MGILSSLFSTKDDGIDIDSEKFERMLDAGDSVLLDVRTAEEFKVERIPNALLIDIYQPDFTSRIDKLDRSKIYLVYCRSGRRSRTACEQMIKMGFRAVHNLKNGIIGWTGKVEKG